MNWTKLLRILSDIKLCNYNSETLNQFFTPKYGHIGFVELIKNYAETALLVNKKIISQEAYCTAQQSSSRVESPKI